jgi:hypothetical protein
VFGVDALGVRERLLRRRRRVVFAGFGVERRGRRRRR